MGLQNKKRTEKEMKPIRYWKIAPGQKGFAWVEQRNNNCIALGWSDWIGDLNNFSSDKEIEEEFDRSTKGKHGTPRQLLEFYNHVKAGNRVVAHSGHLIYGIGTVIGKRNGGYKFNENLWYKHSKTVRWETTFWEPLNAEELLPKQLVNKIRQCTIQELKKKEWDIIEGKVSKENTPFKNLSSWEGIYRAPQFEHEVILILSKLLTYLKIKIEILSPSFPDALIQIKRRGKWVYKGAEIEVRSSGFKSHMKKYKEHPEDCDMIICWFDDWKQKPKKLEVIELRRILGGLL